MAQHAPQMERVLIPDNVDEWDLSTSLAAVATDTANDTSLQSWVVSCFTLTDADRVVLTISALLLATAVLFVLVGLGAWFRDRERIAAVTLQIDASLRHRGMAAEPTALAFVGIPPQTSAKMGAEAGGGVLEDGAAR